MIYPNMSKYLPSFKVAKVTVLTTALFLLSAFLFQVSAFELSPSNMVLTTGASNTVSILATDPSTNGVSVRITTQGMQITGFEPGEGVLYIGICDNGSAFSESEVCADIATPENFVPGQVLATFTVVKTGTGTATIAIDGESKYANGVTITPQSFQVVDTIEELPSQPGTDRTAQALNNALPLLVIAGIILIVIILLLVYILKGRKSSKSTVKQSDDNQSTTTMNSNSTELPALPPLK